MLTQNKMEIISSEILAQVAAESSSYDPHSVTPELVRAALAKSRLEPRDFGALLSPAATGFLEQMCARAKYETARFFGNGIRLFTPLYLANYCVNQCTYCAFNTSNKIKRAKLTLEEISQELDAIAATGLDEVLLLTGESRQQSDTAYIGEAVRQAAQRFSTVGLEIYPLNTNEYAFMHECGADFVSVYQETYDPAIYQAAHPAGPKRCYSYRFDAQERAIKGFMRGVSFGALLGLGDYRLDSFSAGLHAYFLQKKYPHAEISISVPRIRPFHNNLQICGGSVGERELLQVMLAHRLFLPFAGITLSTRERSGFRDCTAGMCATKLSAGVHVGVGGHDSHEKGDEQFEIADNRSVDDIHNMLVRNGLQPVYTDYVRVN